MKLRHYVLLPFLMVPWAGQAATVVTAAQDPWPPFVIDAQQGVSVEIVKSALSSQGYQVEMKIMPWARALSDVEAGSIDLLVAAWVTEARKSTLNYSDEYMRNEIKFIQLAANQFEYQGLPSLSGKSVGIVRGYGYGDAFISADFKRQEAVDLQTNLKKLLDKRIDLTLEDEVVAKAIMAKAGMDQTSFRFTSNALSVNPLHVASGLKNPNSKALIAAFNKGLAEIKGNGTFEQILAKYGVK